MSTIALLAPIEAPSKMRLTLKHFSYRFAEEIINNNMAIRNEIEAILTDRSLPISKLNRRRFNRELDQRFSDSGWTRQPHVFGNVRDLKAKMDFMRDRIGMEVAFGHASFIGIDALKFQIASYAALNLIDFGVYVVTTRNFQQCIQAQYGHKWDGSITYEKVERYLPQFKSAIHVPIFVYGIDMP